MGDFLGSYYCAVDAPSSKLALLRAEQPVSILPMDAIRSSQASCRSTHRATTHARWTALERLHTRDIPSDALVPQPDLDAIDFVDGLLIENAETANGDPDADPEFEIPVASMSLFEPGTGAGLITLPLSRTYAPRARVHHAEGVQCVPCAPGDSPMPKLHRVFDVGMVDAAVPAPVPDFDKASAAVIKSASLRSSLMRFIGRKG